MAGEYSKILKKTKDILAERNESGFFTRKSTNSDGVETEKYSLSDQANYIEKMENLSDRDELKKNADSIYKPIRMVHAR